MVTFEMRLMGRMRSFRATVTEPEPGRTLVETNDSGEVTTFTVEEREDGRRTNVTIATATTVRGGSWTFR